MRLVDELERAAKLDFFGGRAWTSRVGLREPERGVDASGRRACPCPRAWPLAVQVEALLVLATLAIVGDQLVDDRARGRRAIAEGLEHDVAHVRADVDAHLVEQRERTDRAIPNRRAPCRSPRPRRPR